MGAGRAAEVAPREGSGHHLFVECDIRDMEMVRSAVEAVNSSLGGVDVLVNNAGVAAIKPFLDMDPDLPEWHRVVDVNLQGTVNMTYTVGKAMRHGGEGGLTINISSVGAVRCSASKELHQVGYVASKAAVKHLTTSRAIEFAEYVIRMNCVMPGPTHSKLDEQLTPDYREKIAEGLLDRHRGEPLEIGALCVFFASAQGAHLNGDVMSHDGGFQCIN